MIEPLLATTEGYAGFWTDPALMLWSALFRMTEAVIAAAPFLLTGMLVAGMLRGMVGALAIRSLFGVGHWSGPIRGWFIGILLPICSLGALPVARELRRAGIPSGTVLSFVLVAPVLNPISILFGLGHTTLSTLLYFVVGTMIVSLGIGFIWHNLLSGRRDRIVDAPEQLPRASASRLAVSGVAATRGFLDSFADVGLAVLAVGLLGAFLPYGTLQFTLTRDNALATVIMGGVAIPAYVTPFEVMAQYSLIVRDGYSLGAAFALIVLGAGANVGVANWIRREYRYRALSVFIVLLLGTTLILGVTADRIIFQGPAQVDHTHAFDSYTRLPNLNLEGTFAEWYVESVRKNLSGADAVGVVLLGAMLLIAVVLRLMGERTSVAQLLKRAAHETPPDSGSVLNRPVPMSVVVTGSAVGMLASIGLAIYILFPPPSELIAEADVISTSLYEEVRTANHDEINRRVQQWDTKVRKIPIAAFIRGKPLSPEAAEAVDDVVHVLELLRSYNEHGEYLEAAALVAYIEHQHRLSQLHIEMWTSNGDPDCPDGICELHHDAS